MKDKDQQDAEELFQILIAAVDDEVKKKKKKETLSAHIFVFIASV
jgi:hypothetical protein